MRTRYYHSRRASCYNTVEVIRMKDNKEFIEDMRAWAASKLFDDAQPITLDITATIPSSTKPLTVPAVVQANDTFDIEKVRKVYCHDARYKDVKYIFRDADTFTVPVDTGSSWLYMYFRRHRFIAAIAVNDAKWYNAKLFEWAKRYKLKYVSFENVAFSFKASE